jgi:hypothetical protein
VTNDISRVSAHPRLSEEMKPFTSQQKQHRSLRWLMLVIPTTQKAEIRRILVQATWAKKKKMRDPI